MKKQSLILTTFFVALFVIFTAVITFAIYCKNQFTEESIELIRSKGGSIETDGQYHSRGMVNDFIYSLSNMMGCDIDIGHKAYKVKLNENFNNHDMILVNGIPHVQSLYLNSSKMTNNALFNIHGSELLKELHLLQIKCDKKGLDSLRKYAQLKKLTLESLPHVTEKDCDVVLKLKLEELIFINMNVKVEDFDFKDVKVSVKVKSIQE